MGVGRSVHGERCAYERNDTSGRFGRGRGTAATAAAALGVGLGALVAVRTSRRAFAIESAVSTWVGPKSMSGDMSISVRVVSS